MTANKAKHRFAGGGFAVGALCLASCAGPTAGPVHAPCSTGGVEAAYELANQGCGAQASQPAALPEELLLDVGIRAFDVPAADPATAELRRAERAYLAVGLRAALQATGAWGAVRVVSRPSAAIDLGVVARVEQSDGETLALQLRATDARGRRWLNERYRGTATAHGPGQEPFAAVYAAIADDLTRRLRAVPHDELRSIRAVAELRFADRIAPGAFAGYLGHLEGNDGVLGARRLPAAADPMLGHARQVLGRERLFIDTVDEYFTSFEHRVGGRFSDWRRSSLDSAAIRRSLLEEAQARELLGAIHLLSGMASSAVSGDDLEGAEALNSLLDGAGLLAVAARKRQEEATEAATARTDAAVAGTEMLPATLALENSAAILERRVDKQYAKATQALRSLHLADTGEPVQARPLPQPEHFAAIAERAPPALASWEHADDEASPPRGAAPEPERELPPVAAAVDAELAAAARLVKAGRVDAALGMLDGLLEERPSAAYNGRELARIYSALAVAHYRNGDIASASAALETVVAQGADISKTRLTAANFSLARLRFEQDEDALARQALRRGLLATDLRQTACATLCSPEARAQVAAAAKRGAKDPGSCFSKRSEVGWGTLDRRFRQHLDVVRGQIDNGQPEAALATIDGLLGEYAKGAEHALLWRYKASAYSALGDVAQAIQAYEKMLQGPGFVPPRAEGRTVYDLAHLHLAQGNHQRSLCYQRLWLHRSKFARRICPAACSKRAESRLAALGSR